MKKSVKLITAIFVFLSFNFCISAESVKYAYSGFGGGLPTSATKLSDETTQSNAVVSEIETDEEESTVVDYSDEQKAKKKKTAIIVTVSVVGGLVVLGGSIALGYYLADQAELCCQQAANEACSNMIQESCKNISIVSSPIIPIYVP